MVKTAVVIYWHENAVTVRAGDQKEREKFVPKGSGENCRRDYKVAKEKPFAGDDKNNCMSRSSS